MPKVDGGIVIQRPVADVFAYATSAESHLQWVPGIQRAAYLDDGPLHVGSRWEAVVSFGGITVDSVMELSEVVPDRRFAWHSVGSRIHSSGSYTFTPLGPNTTRFDYEFSCHDRVAAVVGVFAMPVALRVLRHEIRSRVAAIKRVLEAGEPVAV